MKTTPRRSRRPTQSSPIATSAGRSSKAPSAGCSRRRPRQRSRRSRFFRTEWTRAASFPCRSSSRRRSIEGFAVFAADKPANVRLCLHHAIMDAASEQRVVSSIRRCGLGERVSLNPLGSRIVNDEELNLLYNACDVGINTSMGEGWGLVSCEHGAAGAAQIVPDHTGCAELWRGRGELIPPARSYVPEFSPLEMEEVSPEGVARALEALYRDPARRQELSRAATEQNPAHSWQAITRQFDDLIVKLGK